MLQMPETPTSGYLTVTSCENIALRNKLKIFMEILFLTEIQLQRRRKKLELTWNCIRDIGNLIVNNGGLRQIVSRL